jgi:methionyl-tRNA formyltransferase
MRIFLCGQKSFGLSTLWMLLQRGEEIVGLSAPSKDAQGRPDKLFGYAEAIGIKTISSKSLNSYDIPENTDLIVSAHSHTFISRKSREATKFGAIGYHPSLLPRHRGRDAIKWAVKMNDCVTGGTVFWLNDSIDGGDIAAQEWCWISPSDNASTLWKDKLFPLGLALFDKVLTGIDAKKIVRIKQDEALATFEPAMNPPKLFRPEVLRLGDGNNQFVYQTVSNSDKLVNNFK